MGVIIINSLCYFRIERQEERFYEKLKKNLLKKDFVFDNRYNITFKDGVLNIEKNINYIEDFFSIENKTNITNITSIIGKNGSGKTALMGIINGFMYNKYYRDMDIILVFKINNRFNIIYEENTVKEINTNGLGEYKAFKYNQDTQLIANVLQEICKNISTVYFSNVTAIRNNLFSDNKKNKNFFNISLTNDLKMNFKKMRFTYLDDRFENDNFIIMKNYRVEKNIKYMTVDNIFDIQQIVMEPKAYARSKNFWEYSLVKRLRIYEKFEEEIYKKENENYLKVKPTGSEEKIYDLLKGEFNRLKKDIPNNKKKICKNIIFLLIVDKYFNELYCSLNDSALIGHINNVIKEKIDKNFSTPEEGLNKIMQYLGEIKVEELIDIYCCNGKREHSLAKSLANDCVRVIENLNERYKKLYGELVENLCENPNIEIDIITDVLYKSEEFSYIGFEPVLAINKDFFDVLYNSISKSKEIMDLFYFEYQGLSSGEQAFLDIYSEFYYIKDDIKTKDLLIFIDEPELYFHPEWQRKLVYDLIKFFNNFFADKNVQIIFTSNSPYTLSDLPKDNVIMLEQNEQDLNTFADNIYTLLKQQYFMDFTIGEFSRQKINKVIKDINDKNLENIDENKEIIKLIGDNLLKNKMEEMLRDLSDKNK